VSVPPAASSHVRHLTSYNPASQRSRGDYPTKFGLLTAVLHETGMGRADAARGALATLVDEHLERTNPEDLQYHIFAAALAKRVAHDRSAEINLYLRQFEQPQIALFNLLAERLPTVALAGRVANAMLAEQMAYREHVTLLDIGIGTGRQAVALLHQLAAQGALPERLTVVAVEPSASSLDECGRALADAARRLELPLAFHPVRAVVEELGDGDWEAIARVADGSPIVAHAAFAAHHVRDAAAADARDTVFRRLRALSPVAVVLCEPNVDHHTPEFFRRFENCWRHFSLTFELIGRLDGVSPGEQTAMKLFFAREIEDILGNAEESRCERHEPAETWVERFRRTGFAPATPSGAARGVAHPEIEVRAHEGYVGLDFRGETLVAVLCAIPDAAAGEQRDG
jgi:hypothetical protein